MSERSFRREARRRASRASRRRHSAAVAAAGVAIGAAALPGSASALTFNVTSNADSGPDTLRQAVLDANMTTPMDTITFAPNVTGTITLTTGRITVTRSLFIDGPGAGTLKVSNATDNAFFQNDTLPSGINVEFEGLTIEGHSSGPGSGGGGLVIGSGTSTTVRNCIISGGTAANGGGGIFVQDTPLSVVDSTISGNMAGTNGGAIDIRGAPLSISGSTLTGNKTTAGDGGAIEITESPGPKQAGLTIVSSGISGNTAAGRGGGIDVGNADGPTSITRSTVSGNQASGDGGGLYFEYGAALSIDSSTFDHNNTPTDGGGLYVYGPEGPVTISDSTIAYNVASSRGGGIFDFNYFDKPFSVVGSTIAKNSGAGTGGGIFRVGVDAIGPNYAGPDNVALTNTIVAQNFDNTGPDLAQGPSASGSFQAGFSLIGSTAGGAAITETTPGSNVLGAPGPFVSPLADNGGPTQTMLPLADGPAIDAGTAAGLTTDQRGLARTVDQPLVAEATGSDGTDIGAAELGDLTLEGAKLSAKKKQKQRGKKVVVAVKAGAAEGVSISATGTVKLGKKKLPLTKPSDEVSANQTTTLKLKPAGKKAAKKIAKALARGKKAKVSVSVEFTDAAGNSDEESARVTLTGKRKK